MIHMTEDLANEIEPDALREAELFQAREVLGDLVGRRIAGIRVEETRIAVEADDGRGYYFYGFMGSSLTGEDDALRRPPGRPGSRRAPRARRRSRPGGRRRTAPAAARRMRDRSSRR